MRVYKVESLEMRAEGAADRCFSSYSPETGFLCRKMKWILLVEPHLSGPNMIV